MQPLTGVILATHQSYGAPDTRVSLKQTVCQRRPKTPCISALSIMTTQPFLQAPERSLACLLLVWSRTSLWPKMS